MWNCISNRKSFPKSSAAAKVASSTSRSFAALQICCFHADLLFAWRNSNTLPAVPLETSGNPVWIRQLMLPASICAAEKSNKISSFKAKRMISWRWLAPSDCAGGSWYWTQNGLEEGRCLGWGYGSKAHTRAASLLSSRKAVGGCTDMVVGPRDQCSSNPLRILLHDMDKLPDFH